MSPQQLQFTVSDTRTLEIPVPADPSDMILAGDILRKAGQDGYRLKAAAHKTSSDQRDPYVVGIRLILERTDG